MNEKNNKKIRLAINGFGRIGRFLLKLAIENPKIEIVAINDLGDVENLAYLLEYDTVQKSLEKISFEIVSDNEKYIVVNDKKIRFLSVRNPSELPWKDLQIDTVAECTGVFTSYEKSNAHIEAGAKKVIISGPVKEKQNYQVNENVVGNTVLVGVNEELAENSKIISNASCTTNAATIPLDILNKKIGIKKAMLTTIHSYTATQKIVDGPVRKGKKDFRRGRAGAVNIVPTSTGSAKQVGKVLDDFANKFDGVSVRVPSVVGSLADITFITKRETTVEEINQFFKDAEKELKYQNLFKTEIRQIVSSDIVGNTYPAIVDLSFTRVVDGDLVKIMVWYDNEAGYTNTLLQNIIKSN